MHLYINTYGTYIHIKDEIFEIKVPLEKNSYKKVHIAPQKIKGIVVGTGAAISTDAIALALKYQIDIVILDEFGNPLGRFWHSHPGSTNKIRRHQLALTFSKEGSIYIKQWLAKKLKNQYDFLQKLKKKRETKAKFIDNQSQQIKNLRKKIQDLPDENIDNLADTIRGLEGTAGRIYFQTLSQLLSKQYQFNGRSSRPAKDQFNAFLNYAYGILYSRVEKSLMIAGLDPYVGILHRDDYNKKSLVYDFIEPYRIWAEETVFKLFSAKKVNNSHTDKVTGGLSLNKAGKELLLQSYTKFLDEDKINYKSKRRTRSDILLLEAIEFAQRILKQKLQEDSKNDFSFLEI